MFLYKRKKKSKICFFLNSLNFKSKNIKQQKKNRVFTEPPPTMERGRTLSRITLAKGSGANFRGRKSNSLMNLCGKATQKFKKSFFFVSLFYLLFVGTFFFG